MLKQWIKIGETDPWIGKTDDPRFGERSFREIDTIEDLASEVVSCTWCVGTAFYYKNICMICRSSEADEWIVMRDNILFESINPYMMGGEKFTKFLRDVEKATDEQLRTLTYGQEEVIDAETLSDDELKYFMPDQFMAATSESEAKAEFEHMTGGPLFAVGTLLEDIYITKELHDDLIAEYEKKKNVLSKEGLDDLVNLILANATVYRTAYKTIVEGFNEDVEYHYQDENEDFRRALIPDEIIASYKVGEPLFFATIYRSETGIIGHFHIMFFNEDGKLMIETNPMSPGEEKIVLKELR